MSEQLLQDALESARHSVEIARQQKLANLKKRLQPGKNQEKELRKACADFEAIFIQKLWQQMRATVPKEGYLHSKEEDMYMSLYDQALAEKLAQRGGIGLGDLLYSQLQKRLEKASADVEPASVPIKFSQKQSNQEEKESQKDKQELDSLLAAEKDPLKKVELLARQIEASAGPGKGGLPAELLRPLELQKKSVPLVSPENLHTRTNTNTFFHWPVQGKISSGFGWRIDPFTGKRAWHAGIDLAVPEGTPVEACWPGKVVFAGEKGGYGKVVILEHKNGYHTVYGHNAKILVQEGEFVSGGQRIALSGNTGRSTGPHLHFEVRKGDVALNPMAWMTDSGNSRTGVQSG
jgi:murein DD-endopeptidase MepM/ murein hydrolase activator NlpD